MAFIMKYIREKKALTTLNKGVYCSFIGRDINVYFIGFIDWEIYVTEYTSGAIQGTVTLSFCFPCKIMPDFETGNHCEGVKPPRSRGRSFSRHMGSQMTRPGRHAL